MNAPALIDLSTASQLVMVPIMGDRMSPKYREGRDAIYYVPGAWIGDDIYALDLTGDGTPSILYVQNIGPGRFRLFGENKHYTDDVVDRAGLEQMMLGPVVCEICIRNRSLFDRATGRAA